MRSLLVVSLALGACLAQGNAQRGGSGGRIGGFSAPHGLASGPHLSGGYGSGFHMPTPQFSPRSFNSLPQYHWNMPTQSARPQQRPSYRTGSHAPVSDSHRYRHDYYRRPYVPYFYANATYLVPGLLNSYWDYPYGFNGGDDPYSANQSNSNVQPQPDAGYEQERAPQYDAEEIPPPPPGPVEPLAQPAVTLVFKDGHSRQVHNYAMTQTTLYILDDSASGRRPEIPLSSIDLPATEKANLSAGVDFSTPATAN